MGIWARSPQPDLQPEEQAIFEALYLRAARVLNDMRLQEDLFTALEDVMLETDVVRGTPRSWRYVNASALRQQLRISSISRNSLI